MLQVPDSIQAATPLAPPSVSLLSSVSVENTTSDRWANGFQIAPEGCGDGGTLEIHCDPPGDMMAVGDAFPPIDFCAFAIYAADRCSTYGFTAREYEERATRKLLACESKLIEREIMLNELAICNTPIIGPGAEDITPGAGTPTPTPISTPEVALATLEGALADETCGSRSVIHVSPYMLSRLTCCANLLRREGNTWLTPTDNAVVPGRRYPASGPLGQPPTIDDEWIYATGMIKILKSPITVLPEGMPDAVERSINEVTFYAIRQIAASWDTSCAHLALNVERC